MTAMNAKSTREFFVSKNNELEIKLASSPDMTPGELAYRLGQLTAVSDMYDWLVKHAKHEFEAEDFIDYIEAQRKKARASAYSQAVQIDDATTFEVKRKLDLGKVMEYYLAATQLKDRKEKLEEGT